MFGYIGFGAVKGALAMNTLSSVPLVKVCLGFALPAVEGLKSEGDSSKLMHGFMILEAAMSAVITLIIEITTLITQHCSR